MIQHCKKIVGGVNGTKEFGGARGWNFWLVTVRKESDVTLWCAD